MELHDNVKILRAISPVSGGANDTASVSQVIDRAGYDGLEFVIALGSLADVDATFTVLIEDGATTGVTDGAVADAYLLGTEAGAGFTFADDDGVRKIGYKGNKRYVRLTITPATNTGAWLHSAVAVLSEPRKAPITSQS
ncbi:MAG: hypothetical protein WC891_02970 [Actinomycetota bacterium]